MVPITFGTLPKDGPGPDEASNQVHLYEEEKGMASGRDLA